VALCLVLLTLVAQFAQPDAGELRVVVTDPSGAAIQGAVTVENAAAAVRRSVETDAAGLAAVRRLPFGAYRLTVSREGFTPASSLVEIRSAIPVEYHVTLAIASVTAAVQVAPAAPLVDVLGHRAGGAAIVRGACAGGILDR
jgi:hypothetical protein